MSVRAEVRASEITDNHGQRPREPATSTFNQVLAWMSRSPGRASIEHDYVRRWQEPQ
jgi:hypothetical protein